MWVAKIAKFTKTAKFTIICKTCDEIHEIYSKGFREGPEKATRIAKTAKFTKPVKFTIICNLLPGFQGRPVTKSTKFIPRVSGKAQRKLQELRKQRNLQKLRNLR